MLGIDLQLGNVNLMSLIDSILVTSQAFCLFLSFVNFINELFKSWLRKQLEEREGAVTRTVYK